MAYEEGPMYRFLFSLIGFMLSLVVACRNFDGNLAVVLSSVAAGAFMALAFLELSKRGLSSKRE